MGKSDRALVTGPHPIPIEALDADIAILGKKGRGKTYTGKGIVEWLLTLGRRVIVLDPLGVWWGLKSSADGESPGFPVAVFGGEHADVPITDKSGRPLARILAAENIPAVIDISGMRKGEMVRFVEEFADEIFTKNREPLTLVLEEADVFAPQNPMPDTARVCHEIDRIARRGRAFGFRLLTITQRPAKLNKDVLTQLSVLVALGITSPQDRDAIKLWVEGHADRNAAKEVYSTLAQLDVGEGWVWAPDFDKLERVRFPKITTLDTSATPKAGEKRIKPKKLAQADIAKITGLLAETNEEKRAEVKAKAAPSAKERLANAQELITEGFNKGYSDGKRQADAEWRTRFAALRSEMARLGGLAERAFNATMDPVAQEPEQRIANFLPPRQQEAKPAQDRQQAAGISGPHQQLLDALAWWAAVDKPAPSRAMVAAVCGWKLNGSHLRNRIGELRSMGLLDFAGDGILTLTPAGAVLAVTPPDRDISDRLRSLLSGPQWQVYEVVRARNFETTRDEIAAALGWELKGSHLRNRLGELSQMDVISYPRPGAVRMEDWAR